MGKLKLNISMSLDGYVAGPDQTEKEPLGIGGEQLHEWLIPLRTFRESHGEEGGEVNASTPFAEDILGGTGATIMGRNMFGGGPGPWKDQSWKGYWGDTRPTTTPSSSSPTIRASRWRCKAGRRPLRHGRHRVGARAGARSRRR